MEFILTNLANGIKTEDILGNKRLYKLDITNNRFCCYMNGSKLPIKSYSTFIALKRYFDKGVYTSDEQIK